MKEKEWKGGELERKGSLRWELQGVQGKVEKEGGRKEERREKGEWGWGWWAIRGGAGWWKVISSCVFFFFYLFGVAFDILYVYGIFEIFLFMYYYSIVDEKIVF
mgnify:CR=1 FL=1